MEDSRQLIQGTPEWFAARIGLVTASRLGDVLAKGVKHDAYVCEIVAEKVTGLSAESTYDNAAMAWGRDHEAEARGFFEAETGLTVATCGMYMHPTLPSGASPDGIIESEDAVLELKCPNTKTHLGYLDLGVLPAKYKAQVQWQMACTGRKKAHFASFDPRMPSHKMFRTVVERDDAYIAKIEREIEAFFVEVEEMIERLGLNA